MRKCMTICAALLVVLMMVGNSHGAPTKDELEAASALFASFIREIDKSKIAVGQGLTQSILASDFVEHEDVNQFVSFSVLSLVATNMPKVDLSVDLLLAIKSEADISLITGKLPAQYSELVKRFPGDLSKFPSLFQETTSQYTDEVLRNKVIQIQKNINDLVSVYKQWPMPPLKDLMRYPPPTGEDISKSITEYAVYQDRSVEYIRELQGAFMIMEKEVEPQTAWQARGLTVFVSGLVAEAAARLTSLFLLSTVEYHLVSWGGEDPRVRVDLDVVRKFKQERLARLDAIAKTIANVRESARYQKLSRGCELFIAKLQETREWLDKAFSPEAVAASK